MKTYEVFVCRAYGICKLVGKSVFSEERIAIRGGLSPKQKNFGSVSWKRHCYCSRGQKMISRTQVGFHGAKLRPSTRKRLVQHIQGMGKIGTRSKDEQSNASGVPRSSVRPDAKASHKVDD